MKVHAYEIRDLYELLHAIEDHVQPQFPGTLRWYRGHGDFAWKLDAHIDREYVRLREHEQPLLSEFRRRAPTRYSQCPDADDLASWLSLARHYGLPTRLLDWTASPLIAAYFAVCDQSHHGVDGALWVLAPGQFNDCNGADLDGIVPAMNNGWVYPLVEEAFGEGDELGPDVSYVAAVPTEIDLRMMLQQSRFTIHSNPSPMDDLGACEHCLMKFRIPASAKHGLQRSLFSLGINDASLFPDMQHLASEILNRYLRIRADPLFVGGAT